MRLVGYVRISKAQESEAASLEIQRRAITAYCEAMGHTLIGVFCDDGESAKTLERPAFAEAMRAVEESDGLVVAKLDRLTRNVRDFCDLSARFTDTGKALISVRDSLDTSSAAGRMMANILATFSQYERELISERTKEALAEKQRQGVKLGRPRHTIPAPVEESIRLDASRHGLSLRQLAANHRVSVAVVRRILASA